MITLSKLETYKRYKGDGDSYGRASRPAERESVNDSEWYLIDLLLQDATVLNRKLGSEQRNAEATQRLTENCENAEVVAEIRRMAAL